MLTSPFSPCRLVSAQTLSERLAEDTLLFLCLFKEAAKLPPASLESQRGNSLSQNAIKTSLKLKTVLRCVASGASAARAGRGGLRPPEGAEGCQRSWSSPGALTPTALGSLSLSSTPLIKNSKLLSFRPSPVSHAFGGERAATPLLSETPVLVLIACPPRSLLPLPFLSPQSWCYFKWRLPAKICTLLITRQLLCVMFNAFCRLHQVHNEMKSLTVAGVPGWGGYWRGQGSGVRAGLSPP